MLDEFRRFLYDDSGPELVEWAVVTVILLLATVLILGAIGDALSARFKCILAELADNPGLCPF